MSINTWSDEWKASWRTMKSMDSTATETTIKRRYEMGIVHQQGRALETLLNHYPWIVYLGYLFWRKILTQFWVPEDCHHVRSWITAASAARPNLSIGMPTRSRTSTVEYSSKAPQPNQTQPRPMTVTQLGVLGDLHSFTREHIPRQFLGRKIPLSVEAWSAAEGKMHRPENGISDAGVLGGEFLLGLMMADQIDIVKILLQDLQLDCATHCWNAGEQWSSTVLQLAVLVTSSTRIPKLLLELGAPPNLKDAYGETVLHVAAQNDRRDLVPLLLEKRFKMNINQRSEHLTPLHLAVYEGHVGMVTLLLQLGADANAKSTNWDGCTPLHYVAKATETKIVDQVAVLIEQYGADVNAQDAQRKTLLHYAAGRGATSLVKLLICPDGLNATIDMVDSAGRTPLKYAEMKQHHDVMKLLQKK